MTDTANLIARLQAGKGPDRELDAAIYAVVRDWIVLAPTYVDAENKTAGNVVVSLSDSDELPEWLNEYTQQIPPLTSSRDACAALQAECLPGWRRSVYEGNKYGFIVSLRLPVEGHAFKCKEREEGEHPTSEPRAHLIAILLATNTKQKPEGNDLGAPLGDGCIGSECGYD